MQVQSLTFASSWWPSTDAVVSLTAICLGAVLLRLLALAMRAVSPRRAVLLRTSVGVFGGCLTVFLLDLLLRVGGWQELWPGPIWQGTMFRAIAGAAVGVLAIHAGAMLWNAAWAREAPYFAAQVVGTATGLVLGIVSSFYSRADVPRFAMLDSTLSGMGMRTLFGALAGGSLGILGAAVARLLRWPRGEAAELRSWEGRLQFMLRGMLWFVLLTSAAASLLAWDHRNQKQNAIEVLVEMSVGERRSSDARHDRGLVWELAPTVGRLAMAEEAAVAVLEAIRDSSEEREPYPFLNELAWRIWLPEKWVVVSRQRLPLPAGHGVWDALLDDLDMPGPQMNERQLTVFRDLGPQMQAALAQVLEHHPDPRVRLLAAEAYYLPFASGTTPVADTSPLVDAMLRDENRDVRLTAAWLLALGRSRNPGEVDALIEAMGDADASVRLAACCALSRSGPAAMAALPVLTRALDDESSQVRSEAVWAIAKIDSSQFARIEPVLVETLRSGGDLARINALCALQQLGRKAQSAIPAVACLKDHDPLIRALSIVTLDSIGADADLIAGVLVGELKTRGNQGWAAAYIGLLAPESKAAIPALIEALDEEDPHSPWQITEALGRFGPLASDAVPVLTRTLNTDDEYLRDAASAALEAIETPGQPVPINAPSRQQ